MRSVFIRERVGRALVAILVSGVKHMLKGERLQVLLQVLNVIAHSSEFENIMVREEEQQELASLLHNVCPMEVRGGLDDKYGKINVLIQVIWLLPVP